MVLLGPCRQISALGRYLAACRHHRQDLADRFRPEARDQHWACELYRAAARDLIPDDAYPVNSLAPEFVRPAVARQFSLN
ncbi:MAG: hypothetical protein JWN86_2566 [Planctomycetota bacterium]|nr:hypothetical protein [Planctomycetota bacterium]